MHALRILDVPRLLPGLALALIAACSVPDRGEEMGPAVGDDGEVTSGPTDGSDEPADDGGGDTSGGIRYDVGDDGGAGGGDCAAVTHAPCDDTDDVANAIGLGCPDEPQVSVTVNAHASAVKTWSSFGNTGAYDPREGSRFAVISTGSLDDEFAVGGSPTEEECRAAYSDDSSLPGGDHYPAPAPLLFEDAGPVTCDVDPSLVGMGDCSNTLESTDAINTVRDYAEIRVEAKVPADATSLAFDFAFLTYEYPDWWQDLFNDFFFVWLESEAWTGNIAFDPYGEVISVNAAFMDYLDADAYFDDDFNNHPTCDATIPTNCTAPELHGTCMAGHGGTSWLTTEIGVTPGENIVLIFGITDVADEQLDSLAFIDNFHWGCEGGGPDTNPAG